MGRKEPTLVVKRSAGGSGGFVGDAKAATAWMLWAAKAVDRTAEFRVVSAGWRSRPWSRRWQAVTPMVVGQKEKGGGEKGKEESEKEREGELGRERRE